jgi:hypothetical protein
MSRKSLARSKGTRVVFPDGRAVQFTVQLSRREAIRRALEERRHKQNPVRDPVAHALDAFERFNFRSARELKKLKIDLATPLIRIGKVPEIHYTSDKEGDPAHYVHFVRRPGTMYAHPDGKLFMIVGGSTRIDDWLRENPPGTLSAANIERATKQFQALTGRARQKVRDPRAYIAKVAWQLERGRVTKYGHR